jgi:hypothetical protein
VKRSIDKENPVWGGWLHCCNKKKICVAVPSDRNVMKEDEKKLEYKILCTEIQRLRNMKCFVMPVITGATRIVTRGLKNLETITVKNSNASSTKAAVLGTSQLRRKVEQRYRGKQNYDKDVF